MFHLAAYTASALGTAVDTDIAAVTDDILTIQNNHFVLGQDLNLLGAFAASPTFLRARLASPKMRQIANPYIRPGQTTAVLPAANANWWDLTRNPFRIPAFEELQLLATANPGTTERFVGLVFIGDRPTPQAIGDVYPVRITSTTAAVTNTWTSLATTWGDTLPSGLYEMVHSEHFSTNAIAHRWIFPNQIWRPGLLSSALNTTRQPDDMLRGALGTLGRFRSNALPILQVYVNGTDAVHEIYAHVVRVGNI